MTSKEIENAVQIVEDRVKGKLGKCPRIYVDIDEDDDTYSVVFEHPTVKDGMVDAASGMFEDEILDYICVELTGYICEIYKKYTPGKLKPVKCVVASPEDFEERGFDLSGITQSQFEKMVERIGDTLVQEMYWDCIDACGLPCNLKGKAIDMYYDERYILVKYVWNGYDPETESHEDYIIIGEGVEDDSYEDRHSLYHCDTFNEFLELFDGGEDFTILDVCGVTNEIA